MKEKNKIAFSFVIEELDKLQPEVRPMFGCHAIYCRERIVLVTRDKGGQDSDEGVWLATTKDHHESLRQVLPSLRSIQIFGSKESSWQVIPKTSDTFEEEVMLACHLIKSGDPRIGTVPRKKAKNIRRKR